MGGGRARPVSLAVRLPDWLPALGVTFALLCMSGVGYLIVYGIFIFYLCLSTIDTSWQLPF